MSGTRSRGGAAPVTASRSGASGTSGGRQTSNRPASGKIGAIRDQARAARNRGGVVLGRGVFIGTCWGCDYWGWYGSSWGRYHGGWWYPAYYPPYGYGGYPPEEEEEGPVTGQGYEAYPYAAAEDNDTFVRARARERHGYGAVTGQYFSDVGSTTRAGRFAFEGALGLFRGDIEFGHYAEPVQGGTDHLNTLRGAVGVQPRLGTNAYLVAGIGARGVFLDSVGNAWGPEGELGIQVFPHRPFGLNVTGRLAGLSWNGGSDYFALRELNTTGSVFIGRMELQGGWHWMKLGGSPAFGGPLLGMRIWF